MTVDMSKLENAISNARAWCGSILDLHGRYLEAIRGDGSDSVETLEDEAREMPLCVEVRTNWYAPGSRDASTKPYEYRVLLTTGGPALQITGTLTAEYGVFLEYRLPVSDARMTRKHRRQYRELLDLSERHGCAIVALDYRRG